MADIYYLDGDGSILCAECAEKSKDDFVEKCRAVGDAFLNSWSTTYCDECSREIVGEEDEGNG
jgi:hypothetical protein